MARKSYNEKLNNAGELPKIEDLSEKPESMRRFGGDKLLVAAPLQYNEIMAKIPKGAIITVDRIRAYLADQAGASATCPLTAGIFVNICAHASLERDKDQIPYWRTLKAKGELNEKYPGGVLDQKALLEKEGHTVIPKGKKYFVENYEDKLTKINTNLKI
jgi:alkylated DNA nucleotide flippase Atl1